VTITYALLELVQVGGGQSIGLGNDRDQVDSGSQTLHNLNIQRLQSVASGTDEVQTAVHTHVA